MPRSAVVALLCAVVFAATMAAPARSTPPRATTDDFAALDLTRWTPTAHPLGRGTLAPANVAVAGGRLRLGLPAGTTDGAEIRSSAAYRSGSFEARIQAARAPSSLTGFFLYAPPDYASEIDIEILDDPTGTVLFTTYAGGRETHYERRRLGFDPTAAPHDYRIDWSAKSATFAVDGTVLRRFNGGVPTAPMNVYLNAWFPRWLDGVPATAGAATLVDRVTVPAR
jgi:endo-1,3-1,4-beta-glycanase ExoK